jgi:hypothetical protein
VSSWICATCAVELVEVSAICADERQWVPADGQHWTTLEELAAAGTGVSIDEVEPGPYGVQPGGHFPGSAVVHWQNGAEGNGVILSGDAISANPDGTSVSFMRRYPNRIPLSGAVVDRVASSLDPFEYDRLYNFGGSIPVDAKAMVRRSAGPPVRRSAGRHAAWTRGDYDYLT